MFLEWSLVAPACLDLAFQGKDCSRFHLIRAAKAVSPFHRGTTLSPPLLLLQASSRQRAPQNHRHAQKCTIYRQTTPTHRLIRHGCNFLAAAADHRPFPSLAVAANMQRHTHRCHIPTRSYTHQRNRSCSHPPRYGSSHTLRLQPTLLVMSPNLHFRLLAQERSSRVVLLTPQRRDWSLSSRGVFSQLLRQWVL